MLAMSEPVFSGLPEPLPSDPLPLLYTWMEQAASTLGRDQPAAIGMALATVGADDAPDVRMVLCKGLDVERGRLTFYTDRSSRKGRHLSKHPRAAAVFYWDALHRQVRVAGPIRQTSDAESDAYFASRPFGSRIAARASLQSARIESRAELEQEYARELEKWRESEPVPRPEHWGGYDLWIERLELWVAHPFRLHDRALFKRELGATETGFEASPWEAWRLQP